MEITLQRPKFIEGKMPRSTIGQMFVDGVSECLTCEDEDRGLEGTDGSGKVKGDTCVPRGRYQIVRAPSPHFKRDLPLLENVPFFSMIWIHWGNKIADTLGCILVGESVACFDGDRGITKSMLTFERLFSKIEAAWNNDEEVWIEIS